MSLPSMLQTLLPEPGVVTRQITIAGSTMNVLDAGAGPVVLLGSSFLWAASMWRPQIAVLAQHYRVIAPDLWGHGQSGPLPAGTADMRDLARHHLALMDQLEIDRFAVVGLSVGGMWGAELAMMAPDRVSALVLMDTSLAAEPAASRNLYFGLLDAVAASRSLPVPVREAVVPLFFSPDVASRMPELPAMLDAALQSWDPERLADSVVPLGRIIFGRRDALDDLTQVAMPVLVMTGSDDLAQPPERGRDMAGRLGCRFLEVPEAGHIANLEAADFVTAALDRFLEASATHA